MAIESYKTVLFDVRADGFATMTLNRPEKLNAFTREMFEEWRDVFANRADRDAQASQLAETLPCPGAPCRPWPMSWWRSCASLCRRCVGGGAGHEAFQ
ncbi:MAG: hypothetical protein O7G83_15435 [Proteobacteria bacterium]|nr:hypothetical protein [Pseudomonadota bacterium]